MNHLYFGLFFLISLVPALGEPGGVGPPGKSPEVGQPARTDRYGDPLPPDAVQRLGTLRFRSADAIECLAVSPDGKTVATGCSATEPPWHADVLLWDLATGRQLGRLTGHTRSVDAVAFSPSGRLLATAGREVVRLWDPATGRELRRLKGAEGHGTALAFSPNGKILATAFWPVSGPAKILLWEVATGKPMRAVGEGHGWVRYLVFSPDGKTLASGGWQNDRSLRLWEVATGRLRCQCGDRSARVYSIAFAPDGRTLFSGRTDAKRAVVVWDPATGKERHSYPGDPGFSGNSGGVQLLALSPNGKLLATLEYDHLSMTSALRLRDAATGRKLRRCESGTSVSSMRCLAFSPDGRRLVAAGRDGDGGKVRVWDVADGSEVFPAEEHQNGVYALAVAPDGKTLASAGGDGTIRLWDLAAAKTRGRLQGDRGPFFDLTFLADGATLATVGGFAESSLRLWQVPQGKEVWRFGGKGPPFWALALSGDGKRIATVEGPRYGLALDEVRIWDVAARTETLRFKAPHGSAYHLALSPDGKTLGIAGSYVHLWDAVAGRQVRQMNDHKTALDRVVFSPDGKILASGGTDGTIRLWDVATGKELHRLTEYGIGIYGLAFSPDGRMLASSGRRRQEVREDPEPAGRVIRLWEVASGGERLVLRGHRGQINALKFSPDGRTLASASSDSSVLIWDVTGRLPWDSGGRLTSGDLTRLAADLGGADLARGREARAYVAQRRLAARPAQAVAWLRRLLHPVPAVDRARLDRLIADLGAADFAVRDKAADELRRLGEVAMPSLRAALRKPLPAEAARRAGQLVANWEASSLNESLPFLRCVEVLEWIGNADARALLARLARGAPEARLTREAQASLRRLAGRPEGTGETR
jgi:WD40 repeat protein